MGQVPSFSGYTEKRNADTVGVFLGLGHGNDTLPPQKAL